MPIEITLHTLPTSYPYQNRLCLEDLEDALRDLLIEKGFGNFTIEDMYTGNTTRPHGNDTD